jgi:hypothetical protein
MNNEIENIQKLLKMLNWKALVKSPSGLTKRGRKGLAL